MPTTPVQAHTPRIWYPLSTLICAGLLQLGCVGNDNPGVGGSSVAGAPSTSGGGWTSVGGGSPSSTSSGGVSSSVVGGSSGIGGASGTTPATCYSPTQNLSIAYDAGAKGCACVPGVDRDICIKGVALICESGIWHAVEDGPCMPQTPRTYSPESCASVGGTPVASPGTPITAETDCPSGVALGIIDFASSGWDEGGLCCAPRKRCGARAGNTCSAQEYCAYMEGQYCGQADAEATCKPRPEACDDIYSPICGCDGKTYASACVAAAAGTGVYADGECAG